MDVENVENLLDYVYTPEDFSEKPSMQEYKKLKRVMKVMVNFYEKGRENKRLQLEATREEMVKLDTDLKMNQEQFDVLAQFPDHHPKRQEYEKDLKAERNAMLQQKEIFIVKEKEFERLYIWGQGIVNTVEWLARNLAAYANETLNMEEQLQINDILLTPEQYKAYKKGLDEVTFNLQESQDFFSASLDGRLKLFHQLEKCMIEAQLQVIGKYPEDSPRRLYIEGELKKDLEFVMDNMNENPKVTTHREKMRQMHIDFFALLKWQRKKMKELPYKESQKITGELESLLKELESTRQADDEFQQKLDALSMGEVATGNQKMSSLGAMKCPVNNGKTTESDEAAIYKVYEK